MGVFRPFFMTSLDGNILNEVKRLYTTAGERYVKRKNQKRMAGILRTFKERSLICFSAFYNVRVLDEPSGEQEHRPAVGLVGA